MPRSSAVFFDVDGVLIDSLPQHLRICEDKAREYGLTGVVVPGPAEFRRRVSQGMKVSPMLNLFLAVGFPQAAAERAVREYEQDFAIRYRPQPFPGIDPMLQRLRANGIRLGLITANIRANVDSALGAALDHFEPACRFYFDSATGPVSKSAYLREGMRRLNVEPQRCTYVGDQPADARAASEARAHFLGVTFGWGLVDGQDGLVLVDNVEQIADALLEGREHASKD